MDNAGPYENVYCSVAVRKKQQQPLDKQPYGKTRI